MNNVILKYRTTKTVYERGFFGLIFGRPGVGKTSLFSDNEKHFFMGNELNSEFSLNGFNPVETWSDFLSQCDKIKKDISQIKQSFNLIVIDNFSDLEGMLVKDFCGRNTNLSSYGGGYGAGYNELEKRTRVLIEDFIKPVQKENLGVVFICHAKEKVMQDHITTVEYTTYRPALEDKTLKPLEAHANFIFHIHTPIDFKSKSSGVVNRVIFTTSKAGSFAKKKSSINLPDDIEFKKDKIKETWNAIYKQVKK